MAADVLTGEAIKETQERLGKFVKKPQLTEKLLKKPPFRFLHDVITCVIRTTGFLQGLFTTEELQSENISDRDSKISFLTKVIEVVNIVTESNLTVKPSKVIAGHEPEKTNELLQKIGYALENKLSSDVAVQKVNGNSNNKKKTHSKKEPPEVKSKKETAEAKPEKEKSNKVGARVTEKSKDVAAKPKVKKNEAIKPQKQVDSKPAAKAKTETVKQPKDAKAKPKQASVSPPEPIKTEETITVDVVTPETQSLSISTPIEAENTVKEESAKENDEKSAIETIEMHLGSETSEGAKIEPEPLILRQVSQDIPDIKSISNIAHVENSINMELVPTSINQETERKKDRPKKPRRQESLKESKENFVNGEPPVKATLQPPPVRTSSARPGAPRLRERNTDVIIQPLEPVLLGKVNVIVENYSMDEEDDGSLVTVDSTDMHTNDVSNEKTEINSDGSHGHLVQQILQTQKELGDPVKLDVGWEYNSRKEREALQTEVENIKVGLQALSRSANPLGKLLDHIQEDVEVMRQEWIQWMEDHKKLYMELEQQRSKLRKREEHSNSVHPGDVMLQTTPAATLPTAPSAAEPVAFRQQPLWQFPPPLPPPYVYSNDQDTLMQPIGNERASFGNLCNNISGLWKRLVNKKPKQEVYTIPPELKPQLKQIYVY